MCINKMHCFYSFRNDWHKAMFIQYNLVRQRYRMSLTIIDIEKFSNICVKVLEMFCNMYTNCKLFKFHFL